MKKGSAVRDLLKKELGKDASAILKKVEKMLKQGVPRAKVEKVLTAALLAHMKKQMKRIHHGIQQLVRP